MAVTCTVLLYMSTTLQMWLALNVTADVNATICQCDCKCKMWLAELRKQMSTKNKKQVGMPDIYIYYYN